jgi:hypothetical protein
MRAAGLEPVEQRPLLARVERIDVDPRQPFERELDLDRRRVHRRRLVETWFAHVPVFG